MLGLLTLIASPFFFGLNTTSTAGYSAAVLADTPVVYYRLAEASGTSATDSSGNSHTGTYTGAGITYSVAGGVTGNNAVTLASASTANMNTGVDAACNPGTGDFSVECWVKNAVASLSIAICKYSGSGNDYYLGVDGANHAIFSAANTDNPAGVNVTGAVTVNDNAWHYLVGVKDGSTLRLYVDGNADGTGAWSGSSTIAPGGNLMVGQLGTGGGFNFNGSLDEVCYYGLKLTPTRITAHWNARTSP